MEAARNEHDDDVLNAAIAAENMDQATLDEEPVVERVLPPDLREVGDDGAGNLAMRS